MHLLCRYDVAPFGRNDAMFAQCAVRHTSLGVAVIIGVANIICLRQTSFKKRTFVGRQKCVEGSTSLFSFVVAPSFPLLYHEIVSMSMMYRLRRYDAFALQI